MAAAHGNWTVVALLPDDWRLLQEEDEWERCANVTLDHLHYFPFLGLSNTGKYTAILDHQAPSSDRAPYPFEEYVVGIYDSAWLVHQNNLSSANMTAAERAETGIEGLYANLYGHASPVTKAEFSAEFSPAESLVFSLTEAGVLKIWSLPDGRLIRALPDLDGAQIDDAEFVDDTACLLVSAKGRKTVFFDPFSGGILQEFPAPSDKFMYDEANQLLFTYSFGERPIRAYESTGYTCRQ